MKDISSWLNRVKSHLKQAKDVLSKNSNEKIAAMAEKVPESIGDDQKRLKVVFAGQYSSGKSTLVRVLTNDKSIKIGAGITTEAVASYDWDGIEITDTPGVHTSKRPDHDEISYKAIAASDLLVFLVTMELFDSFIADHFRKLAIDKGKGHEIMLVVNKMTRCAKGNTPEQQKIIAEDLNKVLAPFSVEDLYTVYIDANSALIAESEEDQAMASELRKRSGMAEFLNHFHRFIHEKGKMGKLSSSLYILDQILQEAIASVSSGNPALDGLEEALVQRRRAIMETRNDFREESEQASEKTKIKIQEKGRKVADVFDGSTNPDDINKALANSQSEVEEEAERLAKALQTIAEKHLQGLDKKLQDVASSHVSGLLMNNLKNLVDKNVQNGSISPQTHRNIGKASDITRRAGEFLIKNSFNPEARTFFGLYKLNQYSGTNTHEWVKAIGKLLGKKFRPFEAVKWTKFIANAGRFLAVAGTVLTFVFQYKEDTEQEALEKELRRAREAVRTGFNDAADSIKMHFDQGTGKFVSDAFDPELEEIKKQLDEIIAIKKASADSFEDLSRLLNITRQLIQELHD